MIDLNRRTFLEIVGAAAAVGIAPRAARAGRVSEENALVSRPIPSTGEMIPAIGLGTWQAFDVDPASSEAAPLLEVVEAFFGGGGKVIDSSPMYGRAEEAVGALVERAGRAGDAFLATKVWTKGKKAGQRQMRASMKKMRTKQMELMQVHNLMDWRIHLATLRGWKRDGLVRYIGVTHHSLDQLPTIESIIEKQSIDFVQIPYSITVRDVEKRVLPAAQASGVAVLVMRPFEGGSLFDSVNKKPLPRWAKDLGCQSWAQYFLKFLLGHPAVTCPIPATRKRRHVEDNLGAGRGALPDEAMRKKMVSHLGL